MVMFSIKHNIAFVHAYSTAGLHQRCLEEGEETGHCPGLVITGKQRKRDSFRKNVDLLYVLHKLFNVNVSRCYALRLLYIFQNHLLTSLLEWWNVQFKTIKQKQVLNIKPLSAITDFP